MKKCEFKFIHRLDGGNRAQAWEGQADQNTVALGFLFDQQYESTVVFTILLNACLIVRVSELGRLLQKSQMCRFKVSLV